MYVCMYVRMCVIVCMYACMYVYYVCMYVCMHRRLTFVHMFIVLVWIVQNYQTCD